MAFVPMVSWIRAPGGFDNRVRMRQRNDGGSLRSKRVIRGGRVLSAGREAVGNNSSSNIIRPK